jgi:hypothetical protein
MRQIALTLLAGAFLASTCFAGDKVGNGKAQSMTGYISDEKCGEKGVGNVECIKKCASEGKKLVFVSDKDHSVLNVANQDVLKGHEGEHVSITAKDVKGALQVSKIAAAK